MDNSQEIWKDYTGSIKAFHGLIKVSNYGRIYKVGTNTSKNQSGILKCTKNTYGYVRLHISINGTEYNKPVHRLVAEMFCPNPDNKPFVDHINANRSDNRASNLRWVTTSENNKNPHYTKLLKQRLRKQLAKHNYLKESLQKPVIAESINGDKLYFKQIKDVRTYFGTKANLNRIIANGRFVKSSKSALKGWKIYLVDKNKQ